MFQSMQEKQNCQKKRYQFLNILYGHTTMKWNIDILEMEVLNVECLYKCYQFDQINLMNARETKLSLKDFNEYFNFFSGGREASKNELKTCEKFENGIWSDKKEKNNELMENTYILTVKFFSQLEMHTIS